jgi:esterase/lipase superfamily enzyme
MNREYIRSYSKLLDRDMEALVFGHSGRPILAFPDQMGRFYQFEDCGMVSAIASGIEEGRFHLFCIEGFDGECWFNQDLSPATRVERYEQYESYLVKEFIPLVRRRSRATHALMVTGCGMGAYYAINFAFRHPEMVKRTVGLSGVYGIGHLLDGYYDQNVYFNSPLEYLPGLTDEWYLFYLLHYMEITLADDESMESALSTRRMSSVLTEKKIPHQLDMWTVGGSDPWSLWRQMIQKYAV